MARGASRVGCGYSQGLRGPPQVISRPIENFDFSPCIEKCKHFFVRFVFDCLIVFNSFGLFSLKKRDLGPKNEVLKERQTKAWDHLQTIELEKLSTKLVSKVSEVEGMISFDHFYTFYRTLKRWTTRICPRQAPCRPIAGPMQAPCRPHAGQKGT